MQTLFPPAREGVALFPHEVLGNVWYKQYPS